MRRRLWIAALVIASGGSFASAEQPKLPRAPELRPLDLDALYSNRFSAVQLLGTRVRGDDAQPLGSVIDVLAGDDGAIHTLLVETDPPSPSGERYIGVPWPDVKLGPQLSWLEVPSAQVRDGSYALFSRRPARRPSGVSREWRARELIGEFADLADVPRYGLVTDVLFDRQGVARAVVVWRGKGSWGDAGTYAYPYPWLGGATSGAYALPFANSDTLSLQRFDYARFGAVSPLAHGPASAAAGASRK
jgi:sporulation protein YlmC with PRC-barrel domain